MYTAIYTWMIVNLAPKLQGGNNQLILHSSRFCYSRYEHAFIVVWLVVV
ncbi:hypothetical protein RchiOBHm_Chr2g0119691 [Rosa chinensis]|uniref:Uncharacterized protein n=1 Tax=Rosa chinensis TaxID=74649 RepID=A0A2P6RS28_ROSCH|nr:hypothetical protein RchiOBHm_Chr2g0119691 [Rosa chinensis]